MDKFFQTFLLLKSKLDSAMNFRGQKGRFVIACIFFYLASFIILLARKLSTNAKKSNKKFDLAKFLNEQEKLKEEQKIEKGSKNKILKKILYYSFDIELQYYFILFISFFLYLLSFVIKFEGISNNQENSELQQQIQFQQPLETNQSQSQNLKKSPIFVSGQTPSLSEQEPSPISS